MLTTKRSFSLILLIGALIIGLTSCKKEVEQIVDSILTSQDNTRAMLYWDDIYKIVEEEATQIDGIRYTERNACIDTVIVDTLSTPRSILIDFGQDDCTGFDGRNRKGQLFVTFTGRYREIGTVITTTPIDYSINGYTLNGTKTVTNSGFTDNDEPYFTVEISDATMTAPGNEWTASWESTRTRVWKEGFDTAMFLDDVYEISGEQNGVGRSGNSYTAVIESPLRIELSCPWITSGIYSLTPEGASTRSIDYGNGACDPNASVTVNGNTYGFTLN